MSGSTLSGLLHRNRYGAGEMALPDVKVHGFVSDVRPLLNAATIYVCPIRDGGGTKLKLLDAFANG